MPHNANNNNKKNKNPIHVNGDIRIAINKNPPNNFINLFFTVFLSAKYFSSILNKLNNFNIESPRVKELL